MADAATLLLLTEARTALHALLTGKRVEESRYSERVRKYAAAGVDELRAYILELEALCPDDAMVLARAGNRRPIGVIF